MCRWCMGRMISVPLLYSYFPTLNRHFVDSVDDLPAVDVRRPKEMVVSSDDESDKVSLLWS